MGWIVPWSGGKDSTATIITMLDDDVPIDKIVHVRMMATDNLPATHKVMTDFVDDCIARFVGMGLEVELLKSIPFDHFARRICKRSKYEDLVGKPYGFRDNQRGMCSFQKEKVRLCKKMLTMLCLASALMNLNGCIQEDIASYLTKESRSGWLTISARLEGCSLRSIPLESIEMDASSARMQGSESIGY